VGATGLTTEGYWFIGVRSPVRHFKHHYWAHASKRARFDGKRFPIIRSWRPPSVSEEASQRGGVTGPRRSKERRPAAVSRAGQ